MIAKFLILCIAVGIANAGILKSAAIIAPEIRTPAIIVPIAQHYSRAYTAPIVHSAAITPIIKTSFIEHRPAVVHTRTVVHTPKVLVKSAPLLRYASAW